MTSAKSTARLAPNRLNRNRASTASAPGIARTPAITRAQAGPIAYIVFDLGVLPAAVELRHSLAVMDLLPLHRDPFDRLLVAQARADGFTIATRDHRVSQYPVGTIW